MIDPRAYEWDRYCERHALPEGELEWLGLTWTCDDDGVQIDAGDIGWPEFLNDGVLELPWNQQRQIYGFLATLKNEPVAGRIPRELVAFVEGLLGDDAHFRYGQEQL